MSTKTGVILAAGKGSRLSSVTRAVPKELLTIGDVPIIEHSVSIMKDAGVKKLIVVVGSGLNGEDGLLIGNKLKNNSSIEIEYFHSISAKSNSSNFSLAKKLNIDLKDINEYKTSNKSGNIIILDCLPMMNG